MHFVGIFLFCSSALGVLGDTSLGDRDSAKWASSPFENDTSIRPFSVVFSDDDIKDLRSRLADTPRKFVPSLQGVGFEYGFNTNQLPEWRLYWREQYDFAARAQYINQYPQFKTNIQGVDVHFVRATPQDTDCFVLPLVILYSFPSAFVDFYKAIPKLNECVFGVSFEVIIPSIPGYGYSDPPTKVGFGAAEAATVIKNLMTRIGYEQFYLASGDITHVGAMLATLYPHNVLGFHAYNLVSYHPLSWGLYVAGAWDPALLAGASYQNKMYPIGLTLASFLAETGFVHILATRPDAIGLAMNESPTAMMAFLLQTSQWLANNATVYQTDGGLSTLNKDEALDSVNLYWFTNCLTSAGRLYSETFNNRTYSEEIYAKKTQVPTWIVTTNSSAITQAPLQYAIKFKRIMKTEYLDKYGYALPSQDPDYYSESVRNAVNFSQFFLAEEQAAIQNNSNSTEILSTCNL